MDTDVLPSIDLFQANHGKAFNSVFDSPIRQLSTIPFWESFDNNVGSSNPTLTQGLQFSSNLDSSRNSPLTSPRARNTFLPQRQETPDRKRPRLSQEPSALDCPDYWLRFDSDDESSEDRTEETGSESPSTACRSPDLAQPVPRKRRATDSIKLAYPSLSEDLVDDSALDRALSEEEESFSMTLDDDFIKKDSTPLDVAPERLYSTPLSWEPPQPGVRMDSFLNMNPSFNDPERQRLLAIAMGTGLPPITADTRPPQSMEFTFDAQQSPSTASESASNAPEPKPRKNSISKRSRSGEAEVVSPDPSKNPRTKSSERAAHNDIERKYRTNLKDRIAELREAIPSLRSVPEEGHEDGDSPIPSSRAPKVSKGTVLSKATEYIHQLERRNRSMAHKNEELLRRLQAFEQLLGAGPAPSWQPQSYGTPVYNPRGYPS